MWRRSSFTASAIALVVYLVIMPACPALSAGLVIDRPFFFENCQQLTNFKLNADGRAVPGGSVRLTGDMRQAINGLLDVWEREGDTDPRRLAFILATARRESSGTWRPVREAPGCGDDELCRERAIGRLLAERAARSGKPVRENYSRPAANGKRYYGRGYIQLTFQSNYERADRQLGTGTMLRDEPGEALGLETSQIILGCVCI